MNYVMEGVIHVRIVESICRIVILWYLHENFLGDHTFNGEETDGNRTFSEGEGDTSKATDTEMASPRKEKKKKSGLRTPSFLKKKKKDKKKEK